MAECRASSGHCCWIEGRVCPFLREDDGERRWVCTFRERLGSWEVVHADPEYLDTIGPLILGLTGVFCGDWPGPGVTCAECGATG
jgi:hypothetical protein